MSAYCVVTASANCAKVYVTRDATHPEVEAGPILVESAEMQLLAEGETFSTEGDAPLVRKLLADALHSLKRSDGTHLVLVADAQLLPALQSACQRLDMADVNVASYQGDLIALSADELQRTLASNGLLPEKTPPSGLT